MAAGLAQTVVASDTLNGASEDTTVLTPTAGSRIVGVFKIHQGSAPEVTIIGYTSDATGDSVTVRFKVDGLSGVTYPVRLTVVEVQDA